MFLHHDFSHVFFNMFALLMFGPILEEFWGPKKFLTFYLVTGVGAGFFYSIINFIQLYDLQNAISAYIINPTPDALTIFINKHGASINKDVLYEFLSAFKNDATNSVYIKESIQFINGIYQAKSAFQMVGASGAVFGILMAFGLSFPQMELYIFPLPIPIKAWIYVTVYGLIELYSGVHAQAGDNVAHFAHIGGMIFAFIMIQLWKKKEENY
jgi:membrane associated rhomboid family serine protease